MESRLMTALLLIVAALLNEHADALQRNNKKRSADFPQCTECYNGGVMVRDGNTFSCECPGGYFGPQCQTSCPATFVLLDNGNYNVGCYKTLLTGKSWYDAATACRRFDPRAQIVVLDSADKVKVVKDYLRNIPGPNLDVCKAGGTSVNFWTAGSRIVNQDCSSPFVWKPSAGQQLPLKFSDWNGGEPNCGNSPGHEQHESCLALHDSIGYKWNDWPCDMQACIVCEIPAGPSDI